MSEYKNIKRAVLSFLFGFLIFSLGCKQESPDTSSSAEKPVQNTAAPEIDEAAQPDIVPAPETPAPVKEAADIDWTIHGLGGGGGLYAPSASPHDNDLMFVACDMGGFYRSTDAGKNWRMINALNMRSSRSIRPVFHPTDPDIVYAYGLGSLRVSHDKGITWDKLTEQKFIKGRVRQLALDWKDPAIMYAGTEGGLFVSRDSGKTWEKASDIKALNGIYINDESECFAAASDGIYMSADTGTTWKDISGGLPWKDIRSMCGASRDGQTVLYAIIPSKNIDDTFKGGVFRTEDKGTTWVSCMGEGINKGIKRIDRWSDGEIAQYRECAMARNNPDIVYVTNRSTGYWPPHHFTVHRSDDRGKTWQFCYNGDPRFKELNIKLGWLPVERNWGWGGGHSDLGFNVCSLNPEIVMYSNNGELYATYNSGKEWYSCYSERLASEGLAPEKGEYYRSCGLEVTTTWRYIFDPHDRERTYIAYTDIGAATSADRGRTWRYTGGTLTYSNTLYDMVCDPDLPGVAYGGCSSHHDIPHWTNIEKKPGKGTAVITRDYGITWEQLGEGLPVTPITSVVLDTASPKDARVLYVAAYGQGLYKSIDSGKTWVNKSSGLGLDKGNNHIWHVQKYHDGTLYCTVTGKRKGHSFPDPGGLYRSDDGADTWIKIKELHWPGAAAIHPEDKNIIYLPGSAIPGSRQGGLYKTTDGGATWDQIVKDGDFNYSNGYIHSFFIRFHPDDPEIVYYSTGTHGLHVSRDNGASWKHFNELPFMTVHRVTFDPEDHGVIYVSTFGGGIWSGPAFPK